MSRRTTALVTIVGSMGLLFVGAVMMAQLGKIHHNKTIDRNMRHAEEPVRKGRIEAERLRVVREEEERERRRLERERTEAEAKAKRQAEAEERDMHRIAVLKSQWNHKPSWHDASFRWNHLESMQEALKYKWHRGGEHHLETDKGMKEAQRLQEELAQPYAEGKAKVEAVLTRIAARYGVIEQSTDVRKFFDAKAALPALETFEEDLKGQGLRKVGRMMRDDVSKRPGLSNLSSFFHGAGTEILRPIVKEEMAKEVERRYAEVLARKPNLSIHHGGTTFRKIAFSPDGTMLAVMNSYRGGQPDGGLRIYATDTGEEKVAISHYSLDGGLAWSPDSKYIAAGASDGTLHIYDVENGGEWFQSVTDVSVTNILWLGEHIAAGWRKEVVGVYKFPSMQCLFKEEVAAYGPRPLDFEVKDGKVTDLLVQAWDLVRVRNGNMEVLGNNDRILAFHPVTKTALQEVRNQGKRPAFRYVLTLQRGDRTLGTFEHRGDPASHVEFCCAAFSRNGKYVVYAAENGLFHLHEVETGKEVFKARYSVGTVHSELGSDTYDTPSLLYPKVESIDVTVGPHGSIIIAVGGGDGVKVYVI